MENISSDINNANTKNENSSINLNGAGISQQNINNMMCNASDKCVAIVLAAGQGKRMNSSVHKQYLLIEEKPVLYYSLQTIEQSFISEVVLVVGKGEIDYCKKQIIEKYGFNKVTQIVEGGKERYHSVMEGLKAVNECSYIFIHDGARPFINHQILKRAYEGVQEHSSCVVGVPVKDTIRVVDENEYGVETPRRDSLWIIQTPQVFSFPLLKEAYEQMLKKDCTTITDDAMIVEGMNGLKPKLVLGSYYNIKITTREDLILAEAILKEIHKN